ncbi:MAG: leucyl/phenylalanyl-tRNA--protein transferase [Akkermansiaceae bacterium]
MERIPPHILLGAYTEGVFPMADKGEIHWFSPLMRGIIPLDDRFHIPHGLKKTLKKEVYKGEMNTSFIEVLNGCRDRDETWIDEVILESYSHLFDLGYCHSFESWDEDGLQGGLYGIAIGRAFFGESMFSLKPDASKVALVQLVNWLRENDFILLDTQWMTDHLRQFGGYELPRPQYLKLLAEALAEDGDDV